MASSSTTISCLNVTTRSMYPVLPYPALLCTPENKATKPRSHLMTPGFCGDLDHNCSIMLLTLYLLMWRIWWAPNASKWQMIFNWAFKGLHFKLCNMSPQFLVVSGILIQYILWSLVLNILASEDFCHSYRRNRTYFHTFE
jgi:hypothetical protein